MTAINPIQVLLQELAMLVLFFFHLKISRFLNFLYDELAQHTKERLEMVSKLGRSQGLDI